MAKDTTSKTAAVRDALNAHPGKTAVAIAKELGVSTALVYKVKAKSNKTPDKAHRKPVRKSGRKAHGTAVAPVAAHAALDSAFEFVIKVGGLLHAEQLIEKLKSIKERL